MKGINIGIDIGGTNIKGVLIIEDKVQYRSTRKTRDGQEDWQMGVKEVLGELKKQSNKPIASVGISAPGIANSGNKTIAFMPGRLQGLENFDWSEFLKHEVHVLNDAHAALWAEAMWGIGKGVLNIAMLTLGTGVGGGLLLNGQLHQGFLQRAGHLGHIAIDTTSEKADNTGIVGSLEEAIGEATIELRSVGRFSSSSDLVEEFQRGDTLATYVWLTSMRKLALGIVSLCNAFSPELIILGGGIAKAGDHLLRPLASFLELYEWRPGGQATPVKLAQFVDYAGAIGSALFARGKSENT
ncbi:MAG: ROK family protein [Bacteroidetes bacterium]|nr:ROK family protein [Bacteroidota bacterium]MDA1120491.1 ROK family protein [Bacteroidota bacterium]